MGISYSFSSSNQTPRGSIVLWGGTIASIPTGWHICDGSNGTIDLTGRIPLGFYGADVPGVQGGAIGPGDITTLSGGGRVIAFDTFADSFPNGQYGPELECSVSGDTTMKYTIVAFIQKIL